MHVRMLVYLYVRVYICNYVRVAEAEICYIAVTLDHSMGFYNYLLKAFSYCP